MAVGKCSSVCSAVLINIVCGTLQVKLLMITNDLSSGSSRCIQFWSLPYPCEFQCQAGKATTKNWKNSIRYQDQPLSRALECYINPDGMRCCRFVGPSVALGLDIPPILNHPVFLSVFRLPVMCHRVFTNRKQNRHLNRKQSRHLNRRRLHQIMWGCLSFSQ